MLTNKSMVNLHIVLYLKFLSFGFRLIFQRFIVEKQFFKVSLANICF